MKIFDVAPDDLEGDEDVTDEDLYLSNSQEFVDSGCDYIFFEGLVYRPVIEENFDGTEPRVFIGEEVV